MEIVGKIIHSLPIQTFGEKGYKKKEFVIETDGQYPKKVCLGIFGEEKINNFTPFIKKDAMVKVQFDAESREYSGRWFTNLNAWKIEMAEEEVQQEQPAVKAEPAVSTAQQSNPTVQQQGLGTSETNDDLPF